MKPPVLEVIDQPNIKPSCVLVEKHDYDGGDPSLDLEKRNDGLYDLTIYKASDDLTVHALTAEAVRAAAHRILALVPDTHQQSMTEPK